LNKESVNPPRRVLLTVPNLDSTISPWREALGLAKYLPRDRFRLTICALRRDGVEESIPLLQDMGIECFVARFRPRGATLRRLLGSLRDSKCLRDHGPFDLQHSMDFTSSPFEALMSRRHARTFLFSQRNMNRNGSQLMLKIKASLAEAIVCVSDTAREFMQGLRTSAKLIRIFPGVDADFIPWRLPGSGKDFTAEAVRSAAVCQASAGVPAPLSASGGEGLGVRWPSLHSSEPASSVGQPFRILMVGHLARLKRFEDGIRAVARLSRDLPRLDLGIAGAVVDPVYLEELKRLVRSEGLEGRVSFLGPRKDILDLMRESDVLLHTAATEAFGMVLVEAMATGLPVVASAIEGPKEIVEDQVSGLLAPPGEVGGYAEAIRALVKNPELGRQLSVNARKRVETSFTARRTAEEMAEAYASLCL
jgi:glycosyltransferase involved in cell wall biosynthesis